MNFAGQVAIVTGGGRGIGRSIAEGLAQRGCNVVVADIKTDDAHEAAAALTSLGVKAMGIKLECYFIYFQGKNGWYIYSTRYPG